MNTLRCNNSKINGVYIKIFELCLVLKLIIIKISNEWLIFIDIIKTKYVDLYIRYSNDIHCKKI